MDSRVLVWALFLPSCGTSDKPIRLSAPQFPGLSKWTLPWFHSKSGLGPKGISIPWQCVRNAGSQAPPGITDSASALSRDVEV